MKFRAHETFFIRKGWLSKGLKYVKIQSDVFVSKGENPMDILGIGSSMVKALRYWMQAVGLTEEAKTRKRTQEHSDFGKLVYSNDRYIEELGTLWILHYNLAKNQEKVTAWYYFFNEFNLTEFNRDDFVLAMNSYISLDGGDVSSRSIEDDFNCIINTYLPRMKSNPAKVNPESNIDCPLGELGLIDIVNKKEKIYKKSHPNKGSIHPLILLAIIIDNAKDSKEIRIASIQNDIGNAGKILNLDIIQLTSLLYKIEAMGYIKVIRTAGLDVVRISKEINFLGCVEEYYRQINQ
ncbi:MAG: DUF4007 family protein [Alkaliphilus sp.]